jgi:hypothetical protein
MPGPNDLNDPASMTVDGSERPLQTVEWSKKDKAWYERNISFCIKRTNFNFGAQTNQRKDLRLFYEVYNNQFPLDWFAHITDPLSAKKKQHKAFPAKVRPVTILRQNIDLLCAEWPRRPFIWQIENLGEDGYSSYMDQLHEALEKNLTDHFMQAYLEQAQANGRQLTEEEMQQLQQNPPTPDEVQEEFQASYKDALCIKAQKWLKRNIRDKDIKKKLHKLFKDWLIAGQCYTYKGIENNELVYRRISPLNIDFDKSEDNDFVEDGEWVVARMLWTLSDVVDKFYQYLTKEQQDLLEKEYQTNSPMGYYENLRGIFTDPQERNKIPVFHVQWKGRKKIGFLSYLDMETFQYVEEVVDENYIPDREKGEQVEWRWVNELYEGYRIGKDMYVAMGPAQVPRTELNNHSACKLNYNGRKFSDTHSENISLLEIGLPFQIMYIIITYILEKTIAKSKGKIVLMDLNAIPDNEDWDDEKFFYYSEAMGYALVDRNQKGVDKTWQGYAVLDLSLFDQIKQLIELQAYFKQQWDDLIGINRQRKGETYASDGQGVNERATFQSTVMTDMIFIRFEEFIQKELQGIIDFMPFLTAKGERSTYTDDDLGTIAMEIFPEDFAFAQLGLFMADSTEVMNKLNQAKSMAETLVQNKAKTSQILEIIDADNMAELKRTIKQMEAIEQKISELTAQNEQEHEQRLEELKKDYMAYEKMLDRQNMEAEYDRKEDIEYIKGAFQTAAFDKDNTEPDMAAAAKLAMDRDKFLAEQKNKQADRDLKRKDLDRKQKELEHKMGMEKRKHTEVEVPKAKAAVRKSKQRPKSGS